MSTLGQPWNPVLALKGSCLTGVSEGVWGERDQGGPAPAHAGCSQGSVWSLLSLCGCDPRRPFPASCLAGSEAQGSGSLSLGAGGCSSPPDGSGSMGHESLRFSFSEQRVSLNCL